MKRFDKYDNYSILTFSISVIICWFLIGRAVHTDPQADAVNLIVSNISSVFSISGLVIAILQIFKVSRNSRVYKEAYDKAIRAVTNNESIILLSKSITQLSIVKQLFMSKLEGSSGIYFDNLVMDLTFLKSDKNIDTIDLERLDAYINYCKEMNTLLYKSEIHVIENFDYSIKYETLTDIQSFLMSIMQKLSTPKEN